jgi:hypothetical protein
LTWCAAAAEKGREREKSASSFPAHHNPSKVGPQAANVALVMGWYWHGRFRGSQADLSGFGTQARPMDEERRLHMLALASAPKKGTTVF